MSERDSLKLTGKEKREFKRENLDSLKKLEKDQKSESFKEKFEKFKADQKEELRKFYVPIFGENGENGTDLQKQDYANDLKELDSQLSEFEKELKEEIGIVQIDLNVLGYDIVKSQFSETAILLGDFDLDGNVEIAPKLQDFSRKNKLWANLFGKNKERKYEKAIKNADVYVSTEDGKKLLSVFGSQISMTYNEVSKVLPEETIKSNISKFYETTKNQPFGNFDKSNPNVKKLHALFQEFPNDITEIMNNGFIVIDRGVDPVATTDVISNPVDYTDPLNLEASLSRGGYPDEFVKAAKLRLGSLFVDGSGAKAGISALAQYDITTIGKNGHLSVYPGVINGTPGLAVAITGPLKNGNRFDVTGTVGFVWPLMSAFGGVDTNLDISSNVRIDGNARKKIGNVVSVSAGALGFAVADTFYLSKDKAEGIESDYQLIKKESTAQYLSQAFEIIPAGSDNKAAKEAVKKYLLDKQEKETSATDGQSTDVDSEKKDKKDKKEKKDKNIIFSEKAAEDTAGYLADVYSATGGGLDTDQIKAVTDTYADLWKNDQNARASRFGVTGLGIGLICWNGLIFPTASVRLTARKLRYNDNESANRRNVNTAQYGGNSIDAGKNFASSIEKYNKMLEIQGVDKLTLELDDDGKTIILHDVLSAKTVVAIAPGVEGTKEDNTLKISKDTKTALVATNEQFGAKYMLVIGDDAVPTSFEGYWTNQGKKDMTELQLAPITEKPVEEKIDLPEDLKGGKIYKSAEGRIFVIIGEKIYEKDSISNRYLENPKAKYDAINKKFVFESGSNGPSETSLGILEISKDQLVTAIDGLPSINKLVALRNNLNIKKGQSILKGHVVKNGTIQEGPLKLSRDLFLKALPGLKLDENSQTLFDQLTFINYQLSSTRDVVEKLVDTDGNYIENKDKFTQKVMNLATKLGVSKNKDLLNYINGDLGGQSPKEFYKTKLFLKVVPKGSELSHVLRPFDLIVEEMMLKAKKRLLTEAYDYDNNTLNNNDVLAFEQAYKTIVESRDDFKNGNELRYLGQNKETRGGNSGAIKFGTDMGFMFGDDMSLVDEKIITPSSIQLQPCVCMNNNLKKYTLLNNLEKHANFGKLLLGILGKSEFTLEEKKSIISSIDSSSQDAEGYTKLSFKLGGQGFVIRSQFENVLAKYCANCGILMQNTTVYKVIEGNNTPTEVPVNPVVPNAPTDTDGNIYILNNQTMTQLVEGHAVIGAMGKQVAGGFQTEIKKGDFQTQIKPGEKTDAKITSTGETGTKLGVVAPSTGETGTQISQTAGGVAGDTGAGIANRNLLDKNN